MTSKKFGIALFALLVMALFAVAPAMASTDAIKSIQKGDTVFVGEEGLNISQCIDGASTTIYWFKDSTSTAFPLDLGSNSSVIIGESDFGTRTGFWYNTSVYADKEAVFNVQYPSISNVQIYDVTAGNEDITGETAITDDLLNIAFQSNLYSIFNERAGAVGGLTVKVQTPDGITLTALVNSSASTPLTAIQPSAQKFYVGGDASAPANAIWDTSISTYASGTYKVWVESNVNSMKDNLGSVSGKTVSPTVEVTLDKETITLTADKETVVRNNQFAVTVEGKPSTEYILWVSGTHSFGATEFPPVIIANQKDVTLNAGAWNYTYKTGTNVSMDIPTTNPELYCANVTTSSSGKVTVGFSTDTNTKDSTYKIRVQRGLPADNMYDTVKVTVEKGAVTITASGDGSYYLGEEVELSGTNTDGDNTYLFITGPNLPVAGGQLLTPATAVTNNVASTFISRPVKSDDTWDYKWDTATVGLDAGTYTIYAVNQPYDKSHLSGTKYDTISIVVKKPFVTATTSASTVAKGDKFYIRGTAEGNPTQGVAIWILGKNYWNGAATSSMETETVNDDGSFEYEVGTATTKDMASGQYFVVVQHPMYNDVFDVDVSAGVGGIVYVQETVSGTANSQFIIAGTGKLQGSDAAEALINAINSPDIDDTYTKLTFLVEEPWIRINSVGDHYVGDQFKISGTTNLAVDDDLIVEVTSSSFSPTQKTQSGEFSGKTETVKVTAGETFNEWSMDVDAAAFKPDDYIVNVEAIEADATATTTFTVLKGEPVKPTEAPVEPTETTAPVEPTATTAPVEPTAAPGFGAFVALIGLGAVAALVLRKD
ncbi:DUF3821 domain-containing protein [Methanoplanus sp. FWC-SCC4]|uniref:DUF3821 domain-containing protein n=1 Tax=Methanochimaera problematica TaxID=2609417 RepID=A0AA97I304_9EURY|nr:MEMAR_RS02690 family S-layer glycoprotein [Methanoplanus sp. FWC-SCC4]WOF16845.1 DUF3821 domain-containing protein [Methanoplanus sp. FWC-SCC4]